MMVGRGLAGILLAAGAWGAAAQVAGYPSRPIRIIVPFAAGGPSDVLARTVGQTLLDAWGQQAVIDNRAGANGIVGTETAARATPDGHTLMLGSNGTHGINASLFPRLSYDAVRDFAPITRIAVVPFVLVAHPSLPVRDVNGLVAAARAKPGVITFGSGGSPSQLAGELFNLSAGVRLLHVPYRGAALALTDVIAGQIMLTFGGIVIATPHVQAGRLRALATTGAVRSAVLPDVPTVGESGVPGYESGAWYGMLAPAGTPAAIVQRLNAAIVAGTRSGAVRERYAAQAFQPLAESPAEYAAAIRAEVAKWAKVVKAGAVKAEGP